MSGWIAPLVAAMVARRQAESTPAIGKSERVRVRYDKRIKVPASSYYAKDFEVINTNNGHFEIVPTKIDVPATQVLHSLVEEYDTLQEAKPFVVREGMVLRATAFMERNEYGEWDGLWQEINLSKHASLSAQQAEELLKAQQ